MGIITFCSAFALLMTWSRSAWIGALAMLELCLCFRHVDPELHFQHFCSFFWNHFSFRASISSPFVGSSQAYLFGVRKCFRNFSCAFVAWKSEKRMVCERHWIIFRIPSCVVRRHSLFLRYVFLEYFTSSQQ